MPRRRSKKHFTIKEKEKKMIERERQICIFMLGKTSK